MSPQQWNTIIRFIYVWNFLFYVVWLLLITWRIMWLYARKRASRGEISTLVIVCICCSIVRNETNFWSADYLACVVYTKTIIHSSVLENGRYLPPFRWIKVNYLNYNLPSTRKFYCFSLKLNLSQYQYKQRQNTILFHYKAFVIGGKRFFFVNGFPN